MLHEAQNSNLSEDILDKTDLPNMVQQNWKHSTGCHYKV